MGTVGEAEVRSGVVVSCVEGEVNDVQVHEAARNVRGAVVKDEVVKESLVWGTARVNIEVV